MLVEVVKKGSVNKGVTESMIFDWIEWHKRIHVNNPDQSIDNPQLTPQFWD